MNKQADWKKFGIDISVCIYVQEHAKSTAY